MTAAGGPEGLRLARDERPDAIILDVITPISTAGPSCGCSRLMRALRNSCHPCHCAGPPGHGVALGAAEHLTNRSIRRSCCGSSPA